MASRSQFRLYSRTAALACAFSFLVAPTLGSAQDFPSRPITLTMPYAPGGPGDAITRVFATSLQKHLGVQVVVDNPAGASGTIGSWGVGSFIWDGLGC